MHVLDFEPMWSPANHALSTTLPAVLALAECAAAPAAWTCLRRAGQGLRGPGLVARTPPASTSRARSSSIRPASWGPIGSAVAAGHLLEA